MEEGLTVIKPIEHVQEHRAHVPATRPVHLRRRLRRRVRPRIRLLPRIAAPPNNHRERKKHDPNHPRLHSSPHTPNIKPIPKQIRARNLARPIQNAIKRPGPDVELRRIEAVELIRVEPVAGQEHGEESHDPDVRREDLEEADDLAPPGGVFHEDDVGAVGADDGLGVDEAPGEAGAQKGQDHEADVRAVGHAAGRGVVVLTDRDPVVGRIIIINENLYEGGVFFFFFWCFWRDKDIYSQPTDDGAQVENHPEPRNVPALRLLGRIGHHNRPLRRPEHPRTDAQNGTRENDKPFVRIVVVT